MDILPLISSSVEGGSSSSSTSDENSACPSLSFSQRLVGFGIFTILGWWIQAMSFASISGMVTGSPYEFAIYFSIGNIITILATCFLIGFKKQYEQMMDLDRKKTSLVYILAMVITVVTAILTQNAVLVFICITVEIAAYVWYTASYIPYGRSFLTKCFKQIIRRN